MANLNWDDHYKKEKSILAYPDENLVRLLQSEIIRKFNPVDLTAADLGCGTGRHLKLLGDLGFNYFFGMDSSFNALRTCSSIGDFILIQNTIESIPFKDESVDVAIAWGSLHYNYKNKVTEMLNEIHRILKPDGRLFATLRADKDTFLKKGKYLFDNTWQTDLNDLSGSIVSFFNETEIGSYFGMFSRISYGAMERSLMGDTSKIVAHWIISAEK